MSAVVFGELEIIIEKIDINQSTLESIINNEELILNSEKNNIKSQYILLTEKEGVKTREIEIDEYGKAKIYLKGFSKEESVLATNDCVMIRYPYMKIKALKNISSIPCSAICIIPNNKLNEILREIENPQHTDWEVKRLNDMSFRNEVKNIIRKLQKGIGDFVYEVLSSSENIEIDIEGASDFLPEVDKGDGNSNEEEKEQSEKPHIFLSVIWLRKP
jgi:hypothetical protein